jgi:hypothetical protein
VHPVPVIHLQKDGLQPLTVVLAGGSELHITMEPATNSMILQPCLSPQASERQIPGANFGLNFAVPKHAVKILGGKPDTDYVEYVIKPKKSHSWLELWFGPYAMSWEPEDDQFIKSADFAQRTLVLPNGATIGVDSGGHLHNGTNWRQTNIVGEGARYTDAPIEDAKLFDQIINSACFTPHPSQ